MNPTDILNYVLAGLGFFAIIYVVRDFLRSRKERDELFARSIKEKDKLFTKTINNHFQHEMKSWKENAVTQQKLAASIDGLARIIKER